MINDVLTQPYFDQLPSCCSLIIDLNWEKYYTTVEIKYSLITTLERVSNIIRLSDLRRRRPAPANDHKMTTDMHA